MRTFPELWNRALPSLAACFRFAGWVTGLEEILECGRWLRFAVANAHKGKVKLTFMHGAHLPDPDGLFNAGLEGNARRAIDFLEGDRLDKRALKRLVRAAIDYNRTHLKKNARNGTGTKSRDKAA